MAIQAQPPFRIGVDVGGTFTDLALVDAAGQVQAFKSPSVPADPAAGVMRAVALAAQGLSCDSATLLRNCRLFVHGSTIATNTLLERKGARVGQITTAGFRDSLAIRRGLRDEPWRHRIPHPAVLVPRHLRLTVRERIDARGGVAAALEAADVAQAVSAFRAAGVEAIAICLINSYRNPAHEQACREQVRALWPEVWVSCSSEIAPIMGEYERSSTAVVNAYVAPRVVPYLRALAGQLAALGLPGGLLLVQSNGGAVTVDEVANVPVQLILSGPAAGVGAIEYFRTDAETENLVAIEIGGTSCDVTLRTEDGVAMTDQLAVDGHHLAIPAVEIHTVGAGGGTIASVDEAGLLQAGPEGAGAAPGPACYQLGGERPTVTDAQLLLGRLRPGPYAGGAIALDDGAARTAMARHVGAKLALDPAAAAAGVIRLVEQNIQHAVERVSIERGHDPRRFTLVACGGAGPLHGVPVARSLGCAAVYIPRLAGVFCAFGMCNADVRHDLIETWLRDLDQPDGEAAMARAFARLTGRADDVLARENFAPADRDFARALDMRYDGQQWPVRVALDRALDAASVRRRFEAAHERLYGYFQPGGRIDVVALRLAGIGRLPRVALHAEPARTEPPPPREVREVWLDDTTKHQAVPVYDGATLQPGHTLTGPAIIDEATTTILVGPADRLRLTPGGNYLISLAS